MKISFALSRMTAQSWIARTVDPGAVGEGKRPCEALTALRAELAAQGHRYFNLYGQQMLATGKGDEQWDAGAER